MIENEFATIRESDVLKGVHFVHPKSIEDSRGRFSEFFRRDWVPGANELVQANHSVSRAGVLRGMHYHLFQADYWYLTSGDAFIALYDNRATSPSAEKTETVQVKDGEALGIYIPPGVAHGFYAVSDMSLLYMVDQYFDGTDELGIYYDDPALEIEWPTDVEPILSDRDRELPMLADIAEENLPL
ncbi:MAG: dTDP-4-dehydrorhamnose 3,5-epimerase family protein [Actinomycetota bacterium]